MRGAAVLTRQHGQSAIESRFAKAAQRARCKVKARLFQDRLRRPARHASCAVRAGTPRAFVPGRAEGHLHFRDRCEQSRDVVSADPACSARMRPFECDAVGCECLVDLCVTFRDVQRVLMHERKPGLHPASSSQDVDQCRRHGRIAREISRPIARVDGRAWFV
eukprot:3587560-Prymnesium_polylepis.1